MAVPTRKKSKAKKRSRRANHDRIDMPQVNICMNCGADVLAHQACGVCGWYKDRVAVEIKFDEEEIEEDEE